MRVPLFKVHVNFNALPKIEQVLRSGFTGQGKVCEEFEEAFHDLTLAKTKPLLMNSCTSALDLAYHLTLKRGDTVITSPQSCLATYQNLLHRGINIVWADVDPVTGNIDVDDVERKMDSDVEAIIAIDWGGRSCDYTVLKSFDTPVIQDAAHSILSRYDDDPIGQSGGDYIAWSFQSIKTLSMADGGALMVPHDKYKEAELLRWFYLDRNTSADFRCAQDTTKPGFKYQSNDVLAALGLANMQDTAKLVQMHRANAKKLFDRLSGIPGIHLPPFDHGSSYWIFTIICDNRANVQAALTKAGVGASEVHRRADLHTAFKEFKRELPGLNYFCDHQLNIPCGWWVSDEDINYIVDTIRKAV